MRRVVHLIRHAGLAAVLSFTTSGCMTTIGQILYFTDNPNVEHEAMVYAGTGVNVMLIRCAIADGPFAPVGHGFPGIVGFIDLIPSIALDTVLLPVTVVESFFPVLTPQERRDRAVFGCRADPHPTGAHRVRGPDR